MGWLGVLPFGRGVPALFDINCWRIAHQPQHSDWIDVPYMGLVERAPQHGGVDTILLQSGSQQHSQQNLNLQQTHKITVRSKDAMQPAPQLLH